MKALGKRFFAGVLALVCIGVSAETNTWTGGGSDENWSTAANWSSGTAPSAGDTLLFSGAGGSSVNDYTAGTSFSGLIFASGASAFTLSGSSLELSGGLSSFSAEKQTIDLPVTLSGGAVTVGDGAELEILQVVSGSAELVKEGGGILSLAAENSYAGGTTIRSGTIRLAGTESDGAEPVSGMVYWLDASDASSLTLGAGNAVSRWNDLSGNSNHFLQADSGLQPVYEADALTGRPGLVFDGTDDCLVFGSSTTPRTVFIVYQIDTASALKGIWGAPDGADDGIRMASTTAWRTANDSNDFTYPSGSAFYVNGVETASFTADTPQLISAVRSTEMEYAASSVGGYYTGRYFSGAVSEVIVYDRALSDSERQDVEDYLMDKWMSYDAPPVSDTVFRLDASDESTMELDAENRISRWNDADGGSKYAGQSASSQQPTLAEDALNGRAAADFGEFGRNTTGQMMDFDSDISTVRTVFWVGRGSNFILTDDNSYHFHRGGEEDTSTIWHSSYAHDNILNGQTYLDGESVDGTAAALPDEFSMVSLVTDGDVEAGRLCGDRTYRRGGQQIAEILIYDRALSDAERTATEAYLQYKWFNEASQSVLTDRLPTNGAVVLAESGTALDLADGDQTIGSLAGVSGSAVQLGSAALTAGGDGSSTEFAGTLSGTGSLIKTGGGTFTLSGGPVHYGETTVLSGTLALGPGTALSNSVKLQVESGAVLAGGGMTLASGQQLAGSGSVSGSVTAGAGASVSPSGSAPLTFSGGFALQSGSELVIGSEGQGIAVSGGSFSCAGPVSLSVSANIGQGTYTLIDWAGAAASGISADDFVLDAEVDDMITYLTVTNQALVLSLVPMGPQAVSDESIAALRSAVTDMAWRYPDEYSAKAADYLARLDAVEAAFNSGGADADQDYRELKREALLLNNPAVDFEELLFVRRDSDAGLPSNWQNVSSVSDTACKDTMMVLDVAGGSVRTLYEPEMDQFLGYPCLHWDGGRLLFTGQVETNNVRPYTVFEMNIDGTGLARVSPAVKEDVDWFDACYLPCGDKLMISTATFAGVPCVNGSDHVGNIYRVAEDGSSTRQLTFDQDQNWGPTILEDGRVMYTRWEYSDTPHYFSRVLFTMMPDGLEQFARYGSSSYFPTSLFDVKPVPGEPSQFVGVISGHHGVKREGELLLFDENLGTEEADGVVHRYCDENPVLPEVRDRYIDERNSWPRFVQPCPLDEKQLIVSARHDSSDTFGLYLVDEFDNIVPLCLDAGSGLFHAVPIRAQETPPVIPDRVRTSRTNGVVNLTDVYFGPGLEDVPRGTIKNLRVYSVHYGYRGMGGHIDAGVDGPWDIHRIMGTVPVHEDGSASFYAPANVPISVQPLDAEGRALQLFRSWYTVMPGETVSCAGCHEPRNDGMYNYSSDAALNEPSEIEPWYGPERGFSFLREVQPVLDEYCIGCHGEPGGVMDVEPDLYTTNKAQSVNWFPQSYLSLHPYVRRTGNEGDYHMNNAGEWLADTSELVQLLKKNHYGVELDDEAWERIYTWIDLNVPAWGIWSEHTTLNDSYERRKEAMLEYAGITTDPEVYPTAAPGRGTFVMPDLPDDITAVEPPADTLFSVTEAKAKRDAAAAPDAPAELTVDLGGGVSLVLDLIPEGAVLMGSAAGRRDEAPQTVVTNSAPFYMGKFEISNEQYDLFDPDHHSGYVPIIGKDHCDPGWPCDAPDQPVMRVSWADAMEYCEWLTKKTGRRFTLPTEAQWEYACRAGTSSDMWYGSADTDWTASTQLISGDSFYNAGAYDNLAGLEYQDNPTPDQNYSGSTPGWKLVNESVTDDWVATTSGVTFASNPFGLCAMHGNAAEWTRSTYAAYPYSGSDGRNRAVFSDEEWGSLQKVVRGGSCEDRGERATSSFRTAMYAWQRGYNVGFRVVADVDDVLSGIPTAVPAADTTSGTASLTVGFDGSASFDEDGELMEFEWAFGDGSTASGTNVSYTYTVPGTYSAVLTVRDDDGFTHSAASTISVAATTAAAPAPIARIWSSASSAAAPAGISFSALDSTVYTDAVMYYWDFGDGILGSGSMPAHTYDAAGRYTVSLTVIDSAGLRDSASAVITVTAADGSESPLADAGPDAAAAVDVPFTLSGSVSGGASAGWSLLDGPGSMLIDDASKTNAVVTFSTNGTYRLELTASDGELSDSDTVFITVSSGGIYRSPQEAAWSPDGTLIAVGDVTARELVLIDPAAQAVRSIALEGEPLDICWNGTNCLYVSECGAGTVAEINPLSGTVVQRFETGPKPAGLALAYDGQILLVTDRGYNRTALLYTSNGETVAHVPAVREPKFVTVTPDGGFAIAANQLPLGDARDEELGAVLTLINLNDPADVHTVALPAGANGVQRPVCSPDGRWAYVPHQMARAQLPTTQLSRGWVSVFAVSIIDLETKTVYATPLLDQSVDGAGIPWGIAIDDAGNTLWLTMQSVHELAKLDLAGLYSLLEAEPELIDGLQSDLTTLYSEGLLERIPLPANGPRGLALSPDGTQLAAASYFTGELLLTDTNGTVEAVIPLGVQPEADTVRRGEMLFHNAANSYQRWVSCTTCHPDGRVDGMNWDLLNDGFGNPKNAKSMLHATKTEPAMWTGVRDNAMVSIQAGFKYIEFQERPDDEYDDIYNYLDSLEPEDSPYWTDGKLTPDAVQGKAIFESRCTGCHRESQYYSGSWNIDVGTRHTNDWTDLDIAGYIPPPLYEMWRSGPYLHDGSAVTVKEVLTTFNADDEHGTTSDLTDNQVNQLAAYLLQLGGAAPDYGTDYSSLNVVDGDGGGSYLPGSTVTITAMDDPPGLAFSSWSGDAVLDPVSAETVVYIPDSDTTATALFADLPGLPDSDADGMPDAWAWQYFGHADPQAYDLSRADDDADGDGRSNYAEYVGGTDPTDSNDVFFVSIADVPSGMEVGFDTQEADGYGYTGLERIYQLKETADLASSSWSSVAGMADVPGSGAFISVTNAVPENQKYFRGEVSLLPAE